ncbi:hypothetical protein J6590_089714 [Homalodisca vitripennis]|nr:hypothetical protein J6590_089714 [Homalodisca vitripennis]
MLFLNQDITDLEEIFLVRLDPQLLHLAKNSLNDCSLIYLFYEQVELAGEGLDGRTCRQASRWSVESSRNNTILIAGLSAQLTKCREETVTAR